MEIFNSKWKIERFQELPIIELVGTMEDSPIAEIILVKLAAEMVVKAIAEYEAKIVLDKKEERNFPSEENSIPSVVTRLGFPTDERLEEFIDGIKTGNLF